MNPDELAFEKEQKKKGRETRKRKREEALAQAKTLIEETEGKRKEAI
jgi:hypothetical protein